jgi:hypothetical protein
LSGICGVIHVPHLIVAYNPRRSGDLKRTGERRMAAAEFLARWKVRYIDAEGRILEELDTTVAECVEDAHEEGFSREDLDQAAGGDLKVYIREAIAKAQGT